MVSTSSSANRHLRALAPWVLWALVWLAGSAPARAGNDPTLKWLTLTTPHFHIHFWEREREVAQRVARIAEVAHDTLVPILEWTPRQRTHIVLTDEVDSANGSATAIPYNSIRLYVTAPEPNSTLNDFDDWLLGLVLHEYTHILHIDNIGGFARWSNAVLGKIYAPNQLQPRWFIEGLATFQETIRSSGGRQRNSIFDMYLRMAFLENRVQTLDQISTGTIRFPGGNAWYLYGSSFVRFIAERYGEKAVAAISRHYGSRPIPFAINRTALKVLGKSFVELYEDWKVHMRRRYQRVQQRAEARGLTPLTRLTWRGERVNRPHFVEGGQRVMYGDDSGRDRSQIAELVTTPTSRDGKQRPRTLLRYFGEYPHPLPDGRHVVYAQNEPFKTYYYYDDLFVWDRKTNVSHRLTRGKRAREAAVSYDGTRVVYVINNLGTTWLAMADLDLAGKPGTVPRLINERILYRGPQFTQVATPVFSPDGKEVAYSTWEAGGYRDIVVYDLTTGKRRHLFRDRAIELDPRYSPDGKYLYFVSDRTGIYNLYAWERATGELYQATNVLGGVFSPDISPDGRRVVFVGFNSYGQDIYTAPLDPATWPKAEPFLDDRPAAQQVTGSGTEYPIRPYSALPTLRPFLWTVGIGVDPFGGSALTLHTEGGDIVGWHGYSIDAIIGFQRGDAQLAATYVYGRLWPDLSLGVSRFVGPRGGFVVDGKERPYIEEDYTLAAGVNFPVLRRAGSSADFQLAYNMNWYRPASSLKVDFDPTQYLPSLPEVGRHATLGLSFTYANSRSYQYSISSEEGRVLSAFVRFGHPYLGGEFRTAEITYSWTEFIKPPWRRWLPQHVLALRYGGGFGFGDLNRRGIYYISGLPQQDLIQGFFFGGRVGGATLRGYPYGAIYGDQYHLLNAEYRFPIVYIERGPSTLPVYLRRIYANVFYDVGNAFFGGFFIRDLRQATGFQLFIDHTLGYVQDARLVISYAHGFQDQGGDMINIFFGSSF